MEMQNITSFPWEILREIVDRVDHRSFFNLLQTSKTFYKVCKELEPSKRNPEYPRTFLKKKTMNYSCTKMQYFMLPNGKHEGVYKAWHLNPEPVLAEESFYINGKKEGPYKTWYVDGELFTTGTYKNNKIYGLCERRFKNGKLHALEYYENGEIIGFPEYCGGL